MLGPVLSLSPIGPGNEFPKYVLTHVTLTFQKKNLGTESLGDLPGATQDLNPGLTTEPTKIEITNRPSVRGLDGTICHT